MQKIKTGTLKKTVSPVEQERRKRKTDAIRAAIRREWAMLDIYYNKRQSPRPECPTLRRLTAAGRDCQRRPSNDRTRKPKFTYQAKGANPIIVKYHASNFGNIRLVPPEKYIRVRQAFGYL